MKPHSFTFSRFTTRKTTNHTRNLKQTTRTVRGGLEMRWLRGRGISLRYPFWDDNFLLCCLLIGELDPISTDKPLLLFAWCVLGQNALLSHRVRTGPGKPGKSWNFILAFSRTGKSWKKSHWSWKVLEISLTQQKIRSVWKTVRKINIEILGV